MAVPVPGKSAYPRLVGTTAGREVLGLIPTLPEMARRLAAAKGRDDSAERIQGRHLVMTSIGMPA
jgi:hypothetical protein